MSRRRTQVSALWHPRAMTDATTPAPPLDDAMRAQIAPLLPGTLLERCGIEVLTLAAHGGTASMPVEGNLQPAGLLHGGASVVMAEALGSTGAALHAATLGKIAVGLDINATHHRSARHGHVTGTAVALSLGGTIASYEVTIVDDDGRRICTSRITCMIRDLPPGA